MLVRLLKRELHYRIDDVRRRVGRAGADGGISHLRKRAIVKAHAQRHRLRLFVETGTYLGDMTAAMAPLFDHVHSIELGYELYRAARERLRHRRNVTLYHGDSALVLPDVLARCHGDTLFWLDAHYSAGITARATIETPVAAELAAIFTRRGSRDVILIDDARLFNGSNDYPVLADLTQWITREAPHFDVAVAEDVIRLTPRRTLS
jgi:hypothetical protein